MINENFYENANLEGWDGLTRKETIDINSYDDFNRKNNYTNKYALYGSYKIKILKILTL
jgi:hypothetical protein